MIICPNFSNKLVKEEFTELVDAVGKVAAYDIWSLNNGNSIDKAPSGALSVLFSNLLDYFHGDRKKAIQAKAKTYSKSFKRWFGDWISENRTNVSKVVDENGEPLIVYHGNRTDTPIIEFDKEKVGTQHENPFKNIDGFWFLTDPNIAKSEYALKPESVGRGSEGLEYGELLPVFLNIKNPLRTAQKGIKVLVHPEYGFLVTETDETFEDFMSRVDSEFTQSNDGIVMDLVDKSQDGDDYRSQQTQLVVTDPNQIKSVFNEGEFSKSNNIYHQMSDKINHRRLNFTAEEFALSQRMSFVLRELFPEIDVKYVDSIEGGYVGESDLKALQILIDRIASGLDTEPHEYAHFYVAMFRNTPLMLEGIRTFGSEEKLVQAVGVRTVEMKAKARNWWLRFVDFIKKMLNKNKYAKKALLAEITDAFLTRSDLGGGQSILDVTGIMHQDKLELSVDEIRDILKLHASTIEYDDSPHIYKSKVTGKNLQSVTTFEKTLKLSAYDENAEDAILKQMSDEARESGTGIHAIMESIWLGTFNANAHRELFTDKALEDAQKIQHDLAERYEFIAAEALLADHEKGVAGTADLLVRDRNTGENLVLDYKTKMFSYKGTSKNRKGKNLNGFKYAVSKKFSVVSTRDMYDFQTGCYKHMLDNLGIPIGGRGIVPIVYSVNEDGKIDGMMVSKFFGMGDKSFYNESLKKKGYVEMVTPPNIQHDIDYGVFKIKTDDEKELQREEMILDLRSIYNNVIKHLTVLKDILSARGKRSRSQQASYLLSRFDDLQELDALLLYTRFGIDLLNAMNNSLNYMLRQPKGSTKLDLATLQEYKDVAASYLLVGQIMAKVNRYSDLLDSNTVKTITNYCNLLLALLSLIVSECDQLGLSWYLDAVAPYIGNVEMDYRDKFEKEFMENNKKDTSESDSYYEAKKKQYIDKKVAENKAKIDRETRLWLKAQTEVANMGFECNTLFAKMNSILESPDPFVQASAMMYYEIIREKDRKSLLFQSKLQKVLKEFREKYGHNNFENLRDVYDDFVEVTEEGCYLVNQYSAEFLLARSKAFEEIRNNEELTSYQKEEARLKWLDENEPITVINNTENYQDEYDDAFNRYFNSVGSEDSKNEELKKLKDIIEANNKKDSKSRKTLYQLLGEGKITNETYDYLKALKQDLDTKYRRPNPSKYKNEKYHAMMALDKDDPKRKLYELLKKLSEEIDSLINNRKLGLNYRLPGRIKRGMEVIGTDGVVSAVSKKIQENSLIRPDDFERGSYVNEVGVKINKIPLPFRARLTEEEQSFDLPTIYTIWYSSAMEYLGKRKIEATILKTLQILDERLTETNTKSLLSKNKDNVPEHKNNTASQFKEWVDQVFYGNRLQDLGTISLPFSDKLIDMAKLLDRLVKYQTQRIMFLNTVSDINNVLVGEVSLIEDVLAKRYITPRAYKKGSDIFFTNTLEMLKDINKVIPDNKINRLADYFGLFSDEPNLSITGFLRHHINDIGRVGGSTGERFLRVRFLLGALCEKQAVDKDGNILGDMLDFIDIDDNMKLQVDQRVANFDTKEADRFSLAIQKILLRTHGNYSQHWSVAFSKYWYGKMGLALRNWIASSTVRRFGGELVDNITQTRFKGFYRDSFEFAYKNRVIGGFANFIICDLLKAEQHKIEILKWSELSNRRKADIKSFGIEMAVAVLAYCLFCVMGDIDDDDDALAMVRYQSYRLFTDLTFYCLPTSFSKILQDPFPTMNLFTDITNLLWLVLSPTEEYNSGNHMFDNKLLDKTIKLLPGFKQIYRFQNIASESEYFIRKS